MRDLERWKDKVELQLDGRQIFFLFFGSAIGACMIFVLGVVVGKRVEARNAAHQQAPAADPLAALDELGSTDEGLTFHSALTERRPPAGGAGRKEPGRDEARPEVPPSRVDSERAAAEARPAKGEAADEERPGQKPKVAVAQKPEKADKPAAQKPEKVAAQKPEKADKPVEKPEVKGHFTLQLSAFATKSEAVDFMRRLRETGYKVFMVESVVPGKGLMYRVRLGDFTSRDSAITAKTDFERKQKMVAYVAKL